MWAPMTSFSVKLVGNTFEITKKCWKRSKGQKKIDNTVRGNLWKFIKRKTGIEAPTHTFFLVGGYINTPGPCALLKNWNSVFLLQPQMPDPDNPCPSLWNMSIPWENLSYRPAPAKCSAPRKCMWGVFHSEVWHSRALTHRFCLGLGRNQKETVKHWSHPRGRKYCHEV